MNHPTVKEFFDSATWTMTYVVYDSDSKDAIVVDPVWDYDTGASKLTTTSAAKVIGFVDEHQLNVHLIAETHAHADHITASQVLKNRWPIAKVAIGNRITDVQKTFKEFFNLGPEFTPNGNQFDLLLSEDEPIFAGSLQVKPISTPGHTPACMSYVIGNAVFTGDALFMPDQGTGRCDFPSGSADDLYTSIHEKLFKLPGSTRVFVGHDYQPNGRPLAFASTIDKQKEFNIHLKENTTRQEFVDARTNRDRTLSAPRLLLPSLGVNIRAGHLPPPESNGSRYLKIPIKEFRVEFEHIPPEQG